MSGINCQLIVCINMFKNRIDNYLVRAGYTYSHRPTRGLSISKQLPCPQPSELLFDVARDTSC